ncbi:MAG: valine--tRNA ligase [Candidatus Lernaella stagnicola]|nr:valine--tRNA ligase [Candidatus Lernaella stagnicola]
MKREIPIHFQPQDEEKRIYQKWIETKAFAATPRGVGNSYVIMMPLPNVTGALHIGHAMDNVMQDLLIRWHRMMGDDTLWMAGTDHAGIATQAIVEKRLHELEGKTRHDIGREALVQRIFDWKDEFQTRIIGQLKSLGCSADWDRLRFTMDAVCSRAVRYTFFKMFMDGIIYRGTRLVNWDCRLQTAVADDEIAYEEVDGHFWYIKYPVIDPQPGEPEFVVVATTRPETMLGDTAVACHPDPRRELERRLAETNEKLQNATPKEKPGVEAELERLQERIETMLPILETFTAMARDGRMINLPLHNRPIPLIVDEWAKPELGTGCVKITPGHDPNDYDVWKRHADEIDILNILNSDGTLNENAGPYQGQDRLDARDKVVADLEAQALVEKVEDRRMEVGHSERSGSPIEPYLSLQWFVKMGDVDGGIVCGRGTDKEFTTPGLAQAAIDAVEDQWHSPGGLNTTFHPDPVRYGKTYLSWLREKRDWCISRQLWWGHRIPIWKATVPAAAAPELFEKIKPYLDGEKIGVRLGYEDGSSVLLDSARPLPAIDAPEVDVLVCLRDAPDEDEFAAIFEELSLVRDPDVLDTWFSSALWPHSTLGWPDPETAQVEQGQTPLGSLEGKPNCLENYYPGSCLVTGRDIITLWVARMILSGLYNLGELPFTDVFIHANILDGKGQRMSKSKGNGIDPVDIIKRYGTDAMRYVLCELQTGTQDIRLPVQALSPFTGEPVDLATAKHGRTIFTYICPETGKEFDVLGTMKDLPQAEMMSDRFDVGVHFCTKLWNAARLAFMNIEPFTWSAQQPGELPAEDRWILSRTSKAVATVHRYLEEYNPAAAINAARSFFWAEFCDWYLEIIKPRLADPEKQALAGQVLATVLGHVLRLFHPFTPFITEALWETLNELAPERGIEEKLAPSELLIHAAWPQASAAWEDTDLERRFGIMQGITRSVRDLRAKYGLPPRGALPVIIKAGVGAAGELEELADVLQHIAVLESLTFDPEAQADATAASAVVGDLQVFMLGVVDVAKEKERLTKQRDKLAGDVERTGKKLANENFVAKAPPAVVEKERARLADLGQQLAAVEENLRLLADA